MALSDAKIPFDAALVTQAPFTGKGGYDAVQRLWEAVENKPTAISFSADVQAGGAMRYFYQQGVLIPRDVSLVGFEDTTLAEFATPPLTTINRNKNRMGAEACRLMFTRLRNPDLAYQDYIVPYRLVERESVRDINV